MYGLVTWHIGGGEQRGHVRARAPQHSPSLFLSLSLCLSRSLALFLSLSLSLSLALLYVADTVVEGLVRPLSL